MHPTTHAAIPAWLTEGPHEDVDVGVIKSGKEAEVFLVERHAGGRTVLLAHKRFRPRHPQRWELRELGFSKGTIYRADSVYRQGWNLSSRDRRAVAKQSRHGQEVVAARWPVNEFDVLRRAHDAGVPVPFPVELTEDGILMEFIGAGREVAPRLVHAQLDRAGARVAWDQLVEAVRRLTRAHIVHGDLSVYNMLWWRGRLVLIDFPQAVDARSNIAAPELLLRDLQHVAGWFERRGVPVDPDALFAELVGDLF